MSGHHPFKELRDEFVRSNPGAEERIAANREKVERAIDIYNEIEMVLLPNRLDEFEARRSLSWWRLRARRRFTQEIEALLELIALKRKQYRKLLGDGPASV